MIVEQQVRAVTCGFSSRAPPVSGSVRHQQDGRQRFCSPAPHTVQCGACSVSLLPMACWTAGTAAWWATCLPPARMKRGSCRGIGTSGFCSIRDEGSCVVSRRARQPAATGSGSRSRARPAAPPPGTPA